MFLSTVSVAFGEVEKEGAPVRLLLDDMEVIRGRIHASSSCSVLLLELVACNSASLYAAMS